MIIVCPVCDTRFLLSATAMGPEGRDVRCAKCSHKWHAVPQEAAAEELVLELEEEAPGGAGEEAEFVQEFAEELPQEDEALQDEVPEHLLSPPITEPIDITLQSVLDGSFDEIIRNLQASPWEHVGWKFTTVSMALLLCALTLVILRDPLYNFFPHLYEYYHYSPENGLVMADMTFKELPSRNKKRYQLDCTILNQHSESRLIPNLRMQLVNSAGDVLAEDDDFLPDSGRILAAGESLPCKDLVIASTFTSAERLLIDLGSPLELFLRPDWDLEDITEKAAEQSKRRREDAHG